MPEPRAVMSGSVDFPASDHGNADPEWLQIDWRDHLHRVELPGAEVNYAEIGEGERSSSSTCPRWRAPPLQRPA